jgi:hypothetical protein
MLRHLLVITPATECHIDGYYPLGTDHCVMVVKDEHDRILITHEVASENGEDTRQFLQQVKDLGLNVAAAFSDYSQSFTEAIKAVYPHARFQADHFHTVKHIWGHLKKSLLSYRRQIKSRGEEKKDEACIALAKKLWKLRWSLLKKPSNLSVEDEQAMAELESEDEGFQTWPTHPLHGCGNYWILLRRDAPNLAAFSLAILERFITSPVPIFGSKQDPFISALV